MKKTDSQKLTAISPSLKSLQSLMKLLELDIKRAYYPAMLWENCVSGCPLTKTHATYKTFSVFDRSHPFHETAVRSSQKLLPNLFTVPRTSLNWL